MNFVSSQFLLFVIGVYFVYWNLPKKYQNLFLLTVSYFFYANWNWRFLIPIFITTITDFFCGLSIYSEKSERLRKLWLIASLIVNLGILGYFKYFNFFSESLFILAQSSGWHVSKFTLNILLPVGISFYTFRSLSYTVDIYRGQMKPTSSFLNYALFVSFFPHLTAGPITRANEFIGQLEKTRYFSRDDFNAGLERFLLGFFKKVFIADTLAFFIVDPIFSDPGNYTRGTLWLGMIGYSVQIYADFSGYSSMAIGVARLFGLKLPENFEFPYLAGNISEFWRRWHMTMSRFFRDYVYISLGGNRGRTAKTIRNLTITTLLSGLWHGSGVNFVLWGALHGFYISIYHLWRRYNDRSRLFKIGFNISGRVPAWLITQMAVWIAWILFRSSNWNSCWIYLQGLVYSTGKTPIDVPFLAWLAYGFFLLDHFIGWWSHRFQDFKRSVPEYIKGLVYASMIVFLYHSRLEQINPFIYFKY